MKYRYAIPLFLCAFLIQTTWMNHLTFFGKSPNLILCLAIMIPFFYGGAEGLVLGVAFGLLQDICFSVLIGPSALAMLAVGLLMLAFRQRMDWDSVFSVMIGAVAGTIAYYFILWKAIDIFIDGYSFLYMLKGLPFLVIYHFVAMLCYYFVIGRRAVKHPQDKSMKGGLIHYN